MTHTLATIGPDANINQIPTGAPVANTDQGVYVLAADRTVSSRSREVC